MKAMHRIFLATLLASGLSLSGSGKAAEPWFSQAELDQMLAPVALYPDTVLSHVLIAATYPLEVIQAARWSRANPGLSGEAAVAAVDHMDWDPSVMALAAFPELLARMDEDIEWTHRLGDAFLVQEPEVIDTIQQLRERAYASGHLKTNEQVRVVRETQYIYIEPARPRVVYVPYYDPFVVYGNWWWSSHPPLVWRYRPRHVASVNFYWGPAYHVAPAFYFSSFHWSRRQVVVVNHHHHHYHGRRHFASGREVARYNDARHWQHNPQHRRGVTYHRGVSEQRFVQSQAAGQTRAAPARNAQARSTQRDWASDRRDSLNLSERQAARSSDTRRTHGQVAERATTPSSGPDAGQRQRSAAQSERVRSEAATQRAASTERQSAPAARQAAPERNARQLQDNLAANRSPATRQERSATPSAANTNRAQPDVARERSTAPGSNNQPTRPLTRERAEAPAASRQAPAQTRPAINRSEPAAAGRQAPAQRSQPSAPARPAVSPQSRPQPGAAPAPRNAPAPNAPVRSAPAQRAAPVQQRQPSAPARPAASPQSRPQPAAAPAPRSAPASNAPAPRAAPAQQRSAPAQRDSGASRARSRER